jgi:hypothetical protein
VLFIICYKGDQIKEDEMSGRFSTHTKFLSENLKTRDHLRDQGLYQRIMLK